MPMSQTYRYGGSSGLMDDHDDPIRSRSRTRITRKSLFVCFFSNFKLIF